MVQGSPSDDALSLAIGDARRGERHLADLASPPSQGRMRWRTPADWPISVRVLFVLALVVLAPSAVIAVNALIPTGQGTLVSILITGGFVLIAAGLVYGVARTVAGPVNELARVARRLMAGDLSARSGVQRHDEIGELAHAFDRMADQITGMVSTLERNVAERTQDLNAAAEVSRTVISVLDPKELMRQAVDLIRDRFDLYYVGLFLVDTPVATRRGTGEAPLPEGAADVPQPEGSRQPFAPLTTGWAVLRAGTGEAGRQMIERGHKLELGSGAASMIGRCVANKEAIIALDVGEEQGASDEGHDGVFHPTALSRSIPMGSMARNVVRFDNPLLPETRSEMALPLVYGGESLGALTIQSKFANAFDESRIGTLQMMADSVAGAIQNARLYATTQEALARSDRIVRRYIQESWDSFVQADETVTGYRHTPRQSGPTEEAWLPVMEQAVREKGLAVASDEQNLAGTSLAIPLTLGGIVIGAIGLRRPAGEPWGENDIAMVQALSEQMSQALENRRLFQVARERARRELILRQTTDRVRTQADLDAVLQVAAQEMRRIAGATHVAIRLHRPSERTSGHGID